MTAEHGQDWEEYLGAYADGELAPAEAAAVEAHVERCARCREALAAIERADQAVLALGAEEPSPAALDALAGRVRTRLGREQRPTRRWREHFSWPRLVPVAAAAVVAVAVLRVADRELPEVQQEIAAGRGIEQMGAETMREGPASSDVAPKPEPGAQSSVLARARGEESTAKRASPTGADREREPGGLLDENEKATMLAAPPKEKEQVKLLAGGPAEGATDEPVPDRAAQSVDGVRNSQDAAKAADWDDAHEARGDQSMTTAPAPAAPQGRGAPAASPLPQAPPSAAIEQETVAYMTLRSQRAESGTEAGRAERLAAAEAEAGPDPSPEAMRGLADLYAQHAADEPDSLLASSWRARSLALTAELYASTGDAADCRRLAARIGDFLARHPGDARSDSLAAVAARLDCGP